MIDEQAGLDRLVEQLKGEPALAIDCEMDSMYAYGTSLCLVQIGWPDHEALIDGLAGLDVTALGELFADPDRLKVFHGGENDVGLMRDRWGLHFEGIFDTMVASQVLGKDGYGLAAVLKRHFDVNLSKKFQKADWRTRPLPKEQAEYARLDVRYLLALRDELYDELEQLGRVEEAESEFARVSRACIPERPFDPENWIKVKGSKELDPKHRAALKAVYSVRNTIAQQLDRAPYRVMHDSGLIELARRPPQDEDTYRKVRGANRRLSAAHVRLILDGLAAAADEGEIPLPANRGGRRRGGDPGDGPRLTPEQESALKSLRKWRTKRSEERGVEVARVATTALLTAIARAAPADAAALTQVDGMEEWRLREYGDEILDVLRSRSR